MTVEQDGEYLHEAHQIIAEELANGGPVEDELDAATAVIDGLHARGWALVTEADFDAMIGAYTLQEVRAGRVTPVNKCAVCGQREQLVGIQGGWYCPAHVAEGMAAKVGAPLSMIRSSIANAEIVDTAGPGAGSDGNR